MRAIWLAGLGLSVLAFAGCGDDDNEDGTASPSASAAASTTASATAPSSGTSASTQAPAGAGLDASFGDGGIASVPLSGTSHDRFMAVAQDKAGNIFATGFVNQSGDQAMALAKFKADGTADTSFGDDGVAIVNVTSGGKTAEISRAVVVLDSGKIVIGGPVEHDTSATGDAAKDTDIAVLRFNEDGTLDGDFGDEGIAIIDLGAGRQVSENSFVGDNSWGIGDLGDGRVVVVASTLAQGDGRTDSDLALFAVKDDGTQDMAFGDNGRVAADIGNASHNARNVTVAPDGTIYATGYGSVNGIVQPIIIKADAQGKLDAGFGDGGITTATVLPGVAESYAIALQGDRLIGAGYGRGADNTEKVDLIVHAWTQDGKLDTSFGTDGYTRLDLAGQDDRGRNVVTLADGRIVVAGSGKLTESNIDAMVVLLDRDGKFVESFGEGGHLLVDLGGPNDSFYGLSISPDGKSVIIAGYIGVDTSGTGNDDAVLAKVQIG